MSAYKESSLEQFSRLPKMGHTRQEEKNCLYIELLMWMLVGAVIINHVKRNWNISRSRNLGHVFEMK